MRKKLLGALMLLSACSGVTPAERATYDAIADDHSAYVSADPRLSAEQVQRRLDLLESWRIRVGAPPKAVPR